MAPVLDLERRRVRRVRGVVAGPALACGGATARGAGGKRRAAGLMIENLFMLVELNTRHRSLTKHPAPITLPKCTEWQCILQLCSGQQMMGCE